MRDALQLKFALEEYISIYEKESFLDSTLLKSIKGRIEEVDAHVLYLIRRSYLEFRDWSDFYQLQMPKNNQEALSTSLLHELLRTEIITAEIHPMFIVDKFFTEKRIFSTFSLKNQFLKNDRLPKILSNNVLKQSLKQGVLDGCFALVKLTRTKNLSFTYYIKEEIEFEEISFEETEFITDWSKEKLTNYLKQIPFAETNKSKDEIRNIKGGVNDSQSPSSDLILRFKKINPKFFSSLQQGIINPLYEKSNDIKLDLTIQIQNPDSLKDQFLISLIKDTTDQLGGSVQEKNSLKQKISEKKDD